MDCLDSVMCKRKDGVRTLRGGDEGHDIRLCSYMPVAR